MATVRSIRFVVQVAVDAEMADRLPGYDGTMYGDNDPPVSGLEIEAQVIINELAQKVIELLPTRLGAVVWERDHTIGPPQSV
jgi:hypothetical protein